MVDVCAEVEMSLPRGSPWRHPPLAICHLTSRLRQVHGVGPSKDASLSLPSSVSPSFLLTDSFPAVAIRSCLFPSSLHETVPSQLAGRRVLFIRCGPVPRPVGDKRA